MRRIFLFLLPAAILISGCRKDSGVDVNPPHEISVDVEQVVVAADSLSTMKMTLEPSDAGIAVSEDGKCPSLSLEVYPFQGEHSSKYGIEKVLPKGFGNYTLQIRGDASLLYLKDSVRLTLSLSDRQVHSKGFIVISERSRTLPTGLEVQQKDVTVLPDSVTYFEVSTVPQASSLEIKAGVCSGLKLQVGDREPEGYGIVRVETRWRGRYRVYVQGRPGLVLNEDVVSLSLDTVGVNGEKTRLTSNSFVCSSENHATFEEVRLTCGGVTYAPLGFCQSHYTFCLPSDADLTKITASFKTNGKNVTVNGQPQTSGVTVNDFSKSVTYTVTSPAGVEREYVVSAYDFDLPVVYIETPDGKNITSKEVWIENAVALMVDGDKTDTVMTSIRGRGNSTWDYPKKPYALKLNEKRKVFGMPKHKRWCLLANWRDRTLMRNAVAFEIARKCDSLKWTPRGVFVETILNGQHKGCYYLCEQVKVDKNRVDIAELDITVTEGEGITGGYILEVDTHMDEVNKFRSERRDLPWMFKDPDDVNSAQFAYLKNYVNEMEAALYDTVSFAARKFTKYMELSSFIDYWFVYELTYNHEPNNPKSVYMNKDRNGKMVAGPVWDFDRSTFRPYDGPLITDALYYGRLFQDAEYVDSVKARWNRVKDSLKDPILAFIDETQIQLTKTDVRNHAMWPIDSENVNEDERLSFTDAVAKLKATYQRRWQWLDGYINGL